MPFQWEKFSVLKIVEDQTGININPDILQFIEKCNLKGKNVVDGGSNIGLISLVLSEAVGEEGLVYAFELQRIIYQIGCANAVLNGKTNIVSFNAALSDRDEDFVGFSLIDYCGENISSVGVRAEKEFGKVKYYDRIKTVILDNLDLQNIGFIKLDLEGGESEALKGMWKSIDRWKPFLLIELSDGYLGKEKCNEVINEIKSHGYTATGISDFNFCFEPM